MLKWADFTESAYVSLLELAKSQYSFISFTGNLDGDKVIIWRHDVDASVHRALRLAENENRLRVRSTFFQLSSMFYNVFEKPVLERIQRIKNLGQQIALHFDPSLYGEMSRESTLRKMAWEKTVLENLFDTEISAVSFHNPEWKDWLSVGQTILCGMVNAYGRYLKDNYGYCSDSNGYWRFDSIDSVLRSGKYSKLQVLTYPV